MRAIRLAGPRDLRHVLHEVPREAVLTSRIFVRPNGCAHWMFQETLDSTEGPSSKAFTTS